MIINEIKKTIIFTSEDFNETKFDNFYRSWGLNFESR